MSDEAPASAPVTADAPAASTVPVVGSNLLADAKVDTAPVEQSTQDQGATETAAVDADKSPVEADAKTEEKPERQGAPEAYADFTVPEGVTMDPVVLDTFKELGLKHDLSQEAAQELLDLGTTRLREAAEAPYKAWADTQKEWQEQVKADKEIGGAMLAENLSVAARAIDKLGGDALRRALDFTGAGNNPEVIRAFVKAGKLLAEPGFATGGAAAPPKTTAEVLYPNMT